MWSLVEGWLELGHVQGDTLKLFSIEFVRLFWSTKTRLTTIDKQSRSMCRALGGVRTWEDLWGPGVTWGSSGDVWVLGGQAEM